MHALLLGGHDPNAIERLRSGGGKSVPLHFAVHTGRLDVVRLLVHHCADPAVVYQWGGTALRVAALFKQDAIARYLVNHGMYPGARIPRVHGRRCRRPPDSTVWASGCAWAKRKPPAANFARPWGA
jgi:hypothetical protein